MMTNEEEKKKQTKQKVQFINEVTNKFSNIKKSLQLKSQSSLQNGPMNFKLSLSETSRENSGENPSPMKGNFFNEIN